MSFLFLGVDARSRAFAQVLRKFSARLPPFSSRAAISSRMLTTFYHTHIITPVHVQRNTRNIITQARTVGRTRGPILNFHRKSNVCMEYRCRYCPRYSTLVHTMSTIIVTCRVTLARAPIAASAIRHYLRAVKAFSYSALTQIINEYKLLYP